MPDAQLRALKAVGADGEFLAVLDHTPGAVVVDDHHYGDVMAHHRVEFHGVETERTVAVEHHHFFIRPRQFGRHAEGNARSQTSEKPRGGGDDARLLPGLESKAEIIRIASVRNKDCVVAHDFLNLRHQTHRMNRDCRRFPDPEFVIQKRAAGGFQRFGPCAVIFFIR